MLKVISKQVCTSCRPLYKHLCISNKTEAHYFLRSEHIKNCSISTIQDRFFTSLIPTVVRELVLLRCSFPSHFECTALQVVSSSWGDVLSETGPYNRRKWSSHHIPIHAGILCSARHTFVCD